MGNFQLRDKGIVSPSEWNRHCPSFTFGSCTHVDREDLVLDDVSDIVPAGG
jgi:hypothetical protein